jgi:hypothetical protein
MKIQSSKRKGKLFRFLCIAHRTKAKTILKNSLQLSDVRWRTFMHFIKSYLAMEEWFHDSNDKNEVHNARDEIAKVLSSLQKKTKIRSHKHTAYPKMHGMTKMQSYIKLFESGMNFYVGPGEAAHKIFVKLAEQKIQRQVSKFAQQTAHQYYNMMLSTHAVQHVREDFNRLIQAETEHVARQQDTDTDGEDNVAIHLSGQYEFEVTHEVLEKIDMDDTIDIVRLMGNSKKNNSGKFKLKRGLLYCLSRKIKESQEEITKIVGHTRAIVTSSVTNYRSIFYAHPYYKREQWYEWAMVHFEETNNLGDKVENYSRLLGFILANRTREAVIQCSINPIDWEDIQQNFIVETQLGTNFHVSFVIVPIDSIVHPLCMFPHDGSNQTNK